MLTLTIVDYWKSHYSNFNLNKPSDFCLTILASNFIDGTDLVIELGCGNGRDGQMLSQRVKNYIGIDLASEALSKAEDYFKKSNLDKNYRFICGDFSKINFEDLAKNYKKVLIYSRFSLHSINFESELSLFQNILAMNRNSSVLMAIEARTIYDELYGKGNYIEKNAFFSDHFRRFIDPCYFLNYVVENFKVIEFHISRGFAKYNEENPLVMRSTFSL